MYKRKYKKLPKNHKNNQRQEASSPEPARGAGAGPCKARSVFRSPPAADNIRNHRYPQTTAGHDRLWPSRARNGRELPSACWSRAEQEGPPRPRLDTTGLEEAGDHHGRERVKRKPNEGHRFGTKDIPNFTRLDKPSPKTLRTTTPLHRHTKIIQLSEKDKSESSPYGNTLYTRTTINTISYDSYLIFKWT
jgi:hypothetical protein